LNAARILQHSDGAGFLTGFGKFTVAKQAGREGGNPQTGAKIKIQPKGLPKFKAGSKPKERVG